MLGSLEARLALLLETVVSFCCRGTTAAVHLYSRDCLRRSCLRQGRRWLGCLLPSSWETEDCCYWSALDLYSYYFCRQTSFCCCGKWFVGLIFLTYRSDSVLFASQFISEYIVWWAPFHDLIDCDHTWDGQRCSSLIGPIGEKWWKNKTYCCTAHTVNR